jgi:hypothetical protein
MSEHDLPSILTRTASVEQSYFPPSRPLRMFQRNSSTDGSSDIKTAFRPQRPSHLRRSITASPAATVTLSTDQMPRHHDVFHMTTITAALTSDSESQTGQSTPSGSMFSLPSRTEDSNSDADDDDSITTLDLSSSRLSCIPAALFHESELLFQIRTLDLSSNPLCSTQDLYLTSSLALPLLETLVLRRCGLSRIDPLTAYLKAPELRELDISGHELTGFVPELRQYFGKLIVLDASGGQFEFIEETALKGLKRIDLRGNRLGQREDQVRQMGERLGTLIQV